MALNFLQRTHVLKKEGSTNFTNNGVSPPCCISNKNPTTCRDPEAEFLKSLKVAIEPNLQEHRAVIVGY